MGVLAVGGSCRSEKTFDLKWLWEGIFDLKYCGAVGRWAYLSQGGGGCNATSQAAFSKVFVFF